MPGNGLNNSLLDGNITYFCQQGISFNGSNDQITHEREIDPGVSNGEPIWGINLRMDQSLANDTVDYCYSEGGQPILIAIGSDGPFTIEYNK